LKDFGIRLAIYEQEIRSNVALSMVAPFARQRVVAVSFGQGLILRE
jgi:hypothetical protein